MFASIRMLCEAVQRALTSMSALPKDIVQNLGSKLQMQNMEMTSQNYG